MTSDRRWAADCLQRSGYDLEDAAADLRRRRYARAISRAASSIEYAIKAALFLVGIDPPEQHDLHAFLRSRRALFPKDHREWVESWAEANEVTSKLVVRAKYGSRVRDRLPDELFSDPHQVEATIEAARRVREQVAELLRTALRTDPIAPKKSRRG